MMSSATKSLQVKPEATYLRSKSESWIQHELDVAILNAEKNRSIQASAVSFTRSQSSGSSKKSSLKPVLSDSHKPDPTYISPKTRTSPRTKTVTLSVSSEKPTEMSSSSNKRYPQISNQGVVVEQRTGINSLQTQIQDMIGGWGCAIKQAIFQEEMGLNEDPRRSPQLLVLL